MLKVLIIKEKQNQNNKLYYHLTKASKVVKIHIIKMDSILYQLKKYKFQFFRGMSNIMTEVVRLMIIDNKMYMNFTVLLQM